MRNRKLFALTMSAILAASMLAGCGSSDKAPAAAEPQKEEAAAEAPEAPAEDAADKSVAPYEEPIDITIGVMATSVQQFFDGDTYADNVWSRRIKEDLNINLIPEWEADVNTDAYNTKINLGLASGEFPDVFIIQDYSAFKQAAEAGLLADMTELIPEYAGEYLNHCMEAYPDSFTYASYDGKIYGLPAFNDNSQMCTLLWIRQDWLDNLGLEAPTTIDELYDVAYAFTFNDPDGNGKDDTYGLGIQNNLITADHATMMGLAGAWGVPLFNNQMFYRNDDGELIAAVAQDEMRECLRFLQKLYNDGILDPEFVVKDQSALTEDIGEGKIGMAFGEQWGTWLPWNLAFENYGAITFPHPIPTVEGYDYKVGYSSNMSGNIICVSAACEHPEAAVKMLNHYVSIINPDTDPEVAKIYDENEQYRFNVCHSNEPQEPSYMPQFEAVYAGKASADDLKNDLKKKYQKLMAFEEGTDTSSDAYGYWGAYNPKGSMHIIQSVYEPDNATVQTVLAIQPDEYVEYASTLEKITLEAYTNIITGADVDSTYDAYVANWLKAGGQEVLDAIDEMYPAN